MHSCVGKDLLFGLNPVDINTPTFCAMISCISFMQMTPQGLMEYRVFDTVDGLYDCAWSEENENILLSASGDGSIKAWDLGAPPHANPLRSLEEHTHEVYSLNWNVIRRDCFLSASWDDSVKLWNLQAPHSLRTFTGHTYCVYAAQWYVP